MAAAMTRTEDQIMQTLFADFDIRFLEKLAYLALSSHYAFRLCTGQYFVETKAPVVMARTSME